MRDGFDSRFHRFEGFVQDAFLVHAAEINELADFFLEELQIFGFVTEAKFANDGHVGRFPFWDVALTPSGGDFERAEVVAREVIAHVGGGQADFAVHDAHGASLPVWRDWGEGAEGRPGA